MLVTKSLNRRIKKINIVNNLSLDSKLNPITNFNKKPHIKRKINYRRLFDLTISTTVLLLASPVLIIVCLMLLFESNKPLFIQERIGYQRKPFKLLKFRTMRMDTIHAGTHLVNENSITPIGRFLRYSKVDELLQLINVLQGDMSLVGPRPCLANQTELVYERNQLNVFTIQPGVTGLAQVLGIDMSQPKRLAKTDAQLLSMQGLWPYLKLLVLTFLPTMALRKKFLSHYIV